MIKSIKKCRKWSFVPYKNRFGLQQQEEDSNEWKGENGASVSRLTGRVSRVSPPELAEYWALSPAVR